MLMCAGRCRMALGMQSGEISDSALSASSSLPNHGPTNARYITFMYYSGAQLCKFSIPVIDIFGR